jgi:hypothetical protein
LDGQGHATAHPLPRRPTIIMGVPAPISSTWPVNPTVAREYRR